MAQPAGLYALDRKGSDADGVARVGALHAAHERGGLQQLESLSLAHNKIEMLAASAAESTFAQLGLQAAVATHWFKDLDNEKVRMRRATTLALALNMRSLLRKRSLPLWVARSAAFSTSPTS